MLTDDQIRDLLEGAEVAFQKTGPTYALTELLLAMRAALPTPIEDLPVEDERVWTDDEIVAHQNEILREFKPLEPLPTTRPALLRPSHL